MKDRFVICSRKQIIIAGIICWTQIAQQSVYALLTKVQALSLIFGPVFPGA